ncbi:MAG: RagB/SusD family nutrient uptake outer membrane protein [Bacteroidetes bacterium]|uniref:RagB/SusD family nutrient uptake outer membrane protein n=1 Tax=Candidatus Cryptobacteroides excrementipullorum TaxID=2840761 RepID=A0A9D9ITP8_9BACT|nr:RagB/SusD family nutrient uptake outer membrane protein [Candidatus Cryptobacteroides excrementipullorum]
MQKNILKSIAGLVAASLAATGCFDMEEHPFTMLSPDNYFTDESSVKQVIANIYAQEQGDLSEFYWYAQELTADQIAWRSWNGGSWGWDSADKFVLSTHTWTPLSNYVNRIWSGAWTAIGLCNNFIADINSVGPEGVGLSQEKFDAYIAEVRTFRVYCFYNIFEVFGGVIPLSISADTETLPQSACAGTTFEEGCRKVCDWMLSELDETNGLLPVNGSVNRCTQAMNRMLKMRILLNSEIFTGEPRFDECKLLAKDIIDGKYGTYSLADNYQEIYSANNDTECKEIIFAFSSDRTYNTKSTNMRNGPFMNYTFASYFDCITVHSGWNCCAVTPSFDNSSNFYDQCVETVTDGEEVTYSIKAEMYDKEQAVCFLDPPYNDKLGAVRERFDPRDIRLVKPYFNGASPTDWGGIFMEGVIRDHYGTGDVQLADADRNGMPLVYVDQIGNFQGKGNHPLQVVENPRWGETNSGIRAAKYPYYTEASGLDMAAADVVEFRLAEVYYTYAECLLREGNAEEAKKWVNDVRKRYFSPEDWENGTTLADGRVLVGAKDQAPRGFSSEFDMDRMLSEWGLEFFDEGHRRRTDLRRFDKFTQGQWWFFGRATETGYDLPAKRDRKYEWFPLPDKALTANPGLVQNPYYN